MVDPSRLHNQSSMEFWYPRLQKMDVPTPDTVKVGMEEIEVDDGAPATDGTVTYQVAAVDELQTAIGQVGGPPAFLRSDQMSGKHRMDRASRLRSTNEEELGRNRWNLLQAHQMAMGLPDPNCYYVREWLDLYSEYNAFEKCPIAAELRFFIHDNQVHDYGFYWPKEAIRQPENDDWNALHERMESVAYERSQTAEAFAREVASVFDGYWSVDFALSESRKWYCIDMARGELSWHPKGCEKPSGLDEPISQTAE